MAESYAIVESGGKQYRAEKGAVLVVDRLPAGEGAKVDLRAVMFRDKDDVVLDGGDLEKVKVEATVAEHLRGEKVRVFKYRPKKGYRRRAGHRSELTRLEVTDVKMLSRKPAAKAKEAAKESKAKPKAPAKGKAPARKAAEKKETRKASAAKKPAEKKASAAKKKADDKSAKKGTTTRKSSSTPKASQRKKES